MLDNKEKVKLQFLEYIHNGNSLKYSIFKETNSSLLYKVERYFGSISKCAEYCGITKEELISKYGMTNRINNKILSEEEILNRLNYLKSINKVTTNAMRLEFSDLKLEYSLKTKYGNVNNALNELGFIRNKRGLTYDEALLKLIELSNSDCDLSYKSMMENNISVYNAIRKELKLDWQKCLKLLNINYSPVKVTKYNRDDIKNKLESIINVEGTISYSVLKSNYSGILSYVRGNYDNIFDFYIDFGYDPTVYMDMTTQKQKGFEFEKIFKEVLDMLNIKYHYNKYLDNNKIRPDFILEDGTILDCKLSSWSDTIVTTYDKYKNHTHMVEIVYLRGKDEYVNINESNFRIVNIKNYLDKLSNYDKYIITNKLNNMINYQVENP